MPLWRKPRQYSFPAFLSTQYRLWCCVSSYSVQYTRYTRKTEPSPTELSSCGSSEQISWYPGPLLTWVKVIPGQSVLKAHSCGFLDVFHADHCGKPWHLQLIRRLASALPCWFLSPLPTPPSEGTWPMVFGSHLHRNHHRAWHFLARAQTSAPTPTPNLDFSCIWVTETLEASVEDMGPLGNEGPFPLSGTESECVHEGGP